MSLASCDVLRRSVLKFARRPLGNRENQSLILFFASPSKADDGADGYGAKTAAGPSGCNCPPDALVGPLLQFGIVLASSQEVFLSLNSARMTNT